MYNVKVFATSQVNTTHYIDETIAQKLWMYAVTDKQ